MPQCYIAAPFTLECCGNLFFRSAETLQELLVPFATQSKVIDDHKPQIVNSSLDNESAVLKERLPLGVLVLRVSRRARHSGGISHVSLPSRRSNSSSALIASSLILVVFSPSMSLRTSAAS